MNTVEYRFLIPLVQKGIKKSTNKYVGYTEKYSGTFLWLTV